MYSNPHDYLVTDHKNGRPRCRGCEIVIQPGTIRIVAKASFKEANTTYPVHVSNIHHPMDLQSRYVYLLLA
jgi:hypothetical protein